MIAPDSQELRDALAAGALVFETAHDAVLDERLNRLSFYTWGDNGCCLPRGTTAATLRGHLAGCCSVGDILIFEEVVSPTTFVGRGRRPRASLGGAADRGHRSTDPSGRLFDEPPVDAAVDVTEIAWDAADALPFPLCLSVEERPGLEVSIAHGQHRDRRPWPHASPTRRWASCRRATLQLARSRRGDCCDKPERIATVPPRFRPTLAKRPLSHGFDIAALLAVPISVDEAWWPASSLLAIDPRAATPLIARLTGTLGAVDRVLDAAPRPAVERGDATEFVVEVENDGRARLRFGDDDHGKRPDPGTAFVATYRVGNGAAGNVGAEAIAHIVSTSNGVFTALRNPLPAAGGVDPEDIEVVAPRCAAGVPHPGARGDGGRLCRGGRAATRCAARGRNLPLDRQLVHRLRHRRPLRRRRRSTTPSRRGCAAISSASAWPATTSRSMRRATCRSTSSCTSASSRTTSAPTCCRPCATVLSSDVLPDGTPRACSIPTTSPSASRCICSRVIAAAQAVEGVDSVRVDSFRRLVDPSSTSLDDGVIEIGDLEIAQLANNPNFPERGKIALAAGGGK